MACGFLDPKAGIKTRSMTVKAQVLATDLQGIPIARVFNEGRGRQSLTKTATLISLGSGKILAITVICGL